MSQAAWEILFWLSAALVAYVFAGYPFLIAALARRFPRTVDKKPFTGTFSVVLVAANEARNLPRKLRNVLACRGADRIAEFYIGSDGSTDATAQIVSTFDDPRVKLVESPVRQGKPAMLNRLVPLCTGDVVVFLDARQELDPLAFEKLLENFADPTVGVVSGELVLREHPFATTVAQGIGFYWKYEKFLRRHESRFRGVPGATGALYAMRRELFQPIDPATLLDDVVIPMQAVCQGRRCLFEPQAIAYDDPSRSSRQEAIRKRRTIAGNAQLVVQHPEWLLPWNNPIWFEFVSHKVLRLAAPLFLLTALACNTVLSSAGHAPWYDVLLTVQWAFYTSALVGWLHQRAGQRSVLFGPSFMFVSLNLTTLAALWDAARSRYSVTWARG